MQDALQHWLNHVLSLSSIVPKGGWAAICATPIVLALFSLRPTVVLTSLLAVVIASALILAPQSDFLIIAIGAYLSAVLVAVLGIQVRRSATAAKITHLESELVKFKSTLENLRQAEERRLFVELRQNELTPEPPPIALPESQSQLVPQLATASD